MYGFQLTSIGTTCISKNSSFRNIIHEFKGYFVFLNRRNFQITQFTLMANVSFCKLNLYTVLRFNNTQGNEQKALIFRDPCVFRCHIPFDALLNESDWWQLYTFIVFFITRKAQYKLRRSCTLGFFFHSMNNFSSGNTWSSSSIFKLCSLMKCVVLCFDGKSEVHWTSSSRRFIFIVYLYAMTFLRQYNVKLFRDR